MAKPAKTQSQSKGQSKGQSKARPQGKAKTSVKAENPGLRPSESVLQDHAIRDLTALMDAGSLEPGVCLDERVAHVIGLLNAGRTPVVVGGSGVGKTTLVECVAARLAALPAPDPDPHARDGFARRRLLEFSLRSLCQRAKNRSQVVSRFRKLTKALLDNPEVTPFLRDLHVAWDLDLEPLVDEMFLRLNRPWMCEGEQGPIERILERSPSIEAGVSLVRLDEPGESEARDLAVEWAKRRAGPKRPWTSILTEEALDGALEIARRFHVRDRLPRTLLGPLSELMARQTDGPVDLDDVVAHASESYALPRPLVDGRVPMDLDHLEARLNGSVVGQGEAVRALVDSIGLFKSGLSDPRRPLGTFLFTGPTGVGKTQLVRALASELLGNEAQLLRVNMSDHQAPNSSSTLFGAPYAMTSGARQGLLTRTLAGRGFGVLLLDEFEKAHSVVHDHFMQLFDEGQFTNGAGQVISCRSFILVATSNAGASAWIGDSLGFPGEDHEPRVQTAVQRALGKIFRPELLNRFDRVVPFRPLSRDTVEQIARRELDGLASRAGCSKRGVSVEIDDAVVSWIASEGYDAELGARPLKRAIERRVTAAIARTLIGESESSSPPRLQLTMGPEGIIVTAQSIP